MTGTLYITATPVGNLSDITLRAIDTLKTVDLIACEDTRVTKILAEKYGFSAPLIDCHKFNEKERSVKIISLLKEGKNVALVSDAGTPGISDPGGILAEEARKEGIKVTSLPGCCAVSIFLSMLKRNTEEYAFIGFMPRKKQEQAQIIKKYRHTNLVFYESPQRLLETLDNISAISGENTEIAVGRELTKMFEEVIKGSVKEIKEYYETRPLKGEIVAMIYAQNEEKTDTAELKEKINVLKKAGFSNKDITKIITGLYNTDKKTVYKTVIEEI